MTGEEQMRLFIGIPLDIDTRKWISETCDSLKETVHDVRWVRPENLHITMKFLGNSPESIIPEIAEVLQSVSVYLPFEMEVGGIGAFSSLGSARVIWVGAYDETGTVNTIYKEIDEGMRILGYSGENRKYSPHITVGRSKKKPVTIDRETAESFKDRSRMTIGELVLFRSDLKSSGAEYMIIERAIGQGSGNQT